MKSFRLMFIALSLALSANVFAKTFSSQFSEFELPNGWDCALEGSEWVCQSENKDRKKEAIIILAAKYRGEQDSLDEYQAYLKAPKSFTLPGGKTQISEAKSVTVREINGQKWVDSLHLASEVPGFYTRYLATVKDSLGIAVTFSVAKDHYDAYQDIFEKIIATLKVFDQKSNAQGATRAKQQEGDLIGEGTYIPDQGTQADISMQKKGKDGSGGDETTTIIGIIAVAAIAFFLIKMKKKKGKK
nr:LPXTG cell wall anchor domain-containing protein [Bacteriovorax sp. HI3]